jgi:hypothetical protein
MDNSSWEGREGRGSGGRERDADRKKGKKGERKEGGEKEGRKEGGREGGRKKEGRKGEREKGIKEGRKGGRKGKREKGRKGERAKGRTGERENTSFLTSCDARVQKRSERGRGEIIQVIKIFDGGTGLGMEGKRRNEFQHSKFGAS